MAVNPASCVSQRGEDSIDRGGSQLSSGSFTSRFEQVFDEALRYRPSPLVRMVRPGRLLKVFSESGQVSGLGLVRIATRSTGLDGHVEFEPREQVAAFACWKQ